MQRLWLIDGSGYIFRAFYAIAPLTNSKGFPTNGLFGFVRMLLPLLKQIGSDPVALVFDAGRATFRTEIFPAYKANRSEPPHELAQQFPFFRTFGAALGFPILELPGFEADDIIGTLSRKASAAGVSVTIVSGDKDLLQLVDDNVDVLDTMKSKRYQAAEVFEKFGVPPNRVVDVLALMGDSSDNVPGLSGVGPKTATQLVTTYGTVEEILGRVTEIENNAAIRGRAKIAETIRTDPEALRLSKRLVEIDCNTPVAMPGEAVPLAKLTIEELIAKLSVRSFDEADLYGLVSQFEFDSLIDGKVVETLRKSAGAPAQVVAVSGQASAECVTAEQYSQVIAALGSQSAFALDFETNSLNPHEAELVGASVCWSSAGPAYYFPFQCNAEPQSALDPAPFLIALQASKALIIGQNLKYDLEVLLAQGITITNPVWDTMIAAHMLNPERGAYNLTVLAREFLNRGVIEFTDLVQDGGTFADVPLARAAEYGGQDAQIAWDLYEKLKPDIESLGLTTPFVELEMPLVSVLAAMESRGIMLDELLLARLSDEFAEKLALLETQIHTMAGGPFNINSPKQLGTVLFEKLSLPTKGLKKTKTGISTDASVLEKLADVHPLPKLLLEYRGFFKLKSTYVDALPLSVSRKTRRIHCKLNQAGTATGRLSSSDPNLQNIPISTHEGRRIREAFIAPPGKKLLSADYSQIELRILAHMANDSAMQRTFAAGIDVHAATAREILGLSVDAPVSSDQRRIGKTINFGIIYGMGPYRLARELGISNAEAARYIEGYFARFSGVRTFFDKVEHEAQVGGAVVTLGGRKRFLSQISGEGRDPDFVRRAALNAPIQGSAADLMKRAMIDIENLYRVGKLPGTLILQVHDELLFEVSEDEVAQLSQLVKTTMESVWSLSVPLVAAVGVGINWQEAHS